MGVCVVSSVDVGVRVRVDVGLSVSVCVDVSVCVCVRADVCFSRYEQEGSTSVAGRLGAPGGSLSSTDDRGFRPHRSLDLTEIYKMSHATYA